MKSAIPALLLCFLVVSCNHSTGPTKSKDPRDYTWTVDTLSYPGSSQTSMYGIWGSSEHDVYVVGHNDQNRGLMWHFDGLTWSDVHLSTSQGGQISGRIDLYDVYGVDASHIWAVGEHLQSNPTPPPNFLSWVAVIEFNGTSWQEVPMSRVDGTGYCIWASSPNDVWIGGSSGIMLHYNGSTLTPTAFPSTWNVKALAGMGPSHVAALAYRLNSPSNDTLFGSYWTFDGVSWIESDSSADGNSRSQRFGLASVSAIDGSFYVCGWNVVRRLATSWEVFFGDPLGQGIGCIQGTSKNNMFAVGFNIFHYNGSDWHLFQGLQSANAYTRCWLNDRAAFAVADGGSKSFVLRGR